MNRELRDYISDALSSGVSEEAIRQTLESQGGWTDSDLNPIFDTLRSGSSGVTSNPSASQSGPDLGQIAELDAVEPTEPAISQSQTSTPFPPAPLSPARLSNAPSPRAECRRGPGEPRRAGSERRESP